MIIEKRILDICSGSGAWSRPYADAGYDVVTIDLPNDCRLIKYDPPFYGILAAPPCNMFALSGNRWKRTQEQYQEALSVVDACLRAVVIYHPKFWALENPTGTLRNWLGPPQFTFQPCDYGHNYTKRTNLWGHFTPPWKHKVEATEGSKMHKKIRDPKIRAQTPAKFAQYFFEANR